MMAEIRAIAWDIDGTLVDSEPLHDEVLISTCADCGVDLRDLPADRFLGVHVNDVWLALEERLIGRIERDAWMRLLTGTYVNRSSELAGFPDVVPVMRALAARGIRQVCVSNSGREIVDANLAALGVGDMVDFSISLDDVNHGKPDPEPYISAARRLGLSPSQMAAVEDSPTGSRAAHAAGMRVFGIGSSPIPLAEITVATREELLPFLISSKSEPITSPRSAAYGS